MCDQTRSVQFGLPGNLWERKNECSQIFSLINSPHNLRHHTMTKLVESVDACERAISSISGEACRRVLTDCSLTRQETRRKAIAGGRRAVISGKGQSQNKTIKSELSGRADFCPVEQDLSVGTLELPRPRLRREPVAGRTWRIFAALRRAGLGCWVDQQRRLRGSPTWIAQKRIMVGTGRFELPTPRTPSECSTRLSHVPTQWSRLG